MRTPPDTPPPNYLGRKFQLRMMSMVGLLVLVLVAIDRAREPSSWYWLTGPPRPAPSSPDAADTPEPVTPELLDAVTVPGEDLAEITDDSVGLRGEESGPYHRIHWRRHRTQVHPGSSLDPSGPEYLAPDTTPSAPSVLASARRKLCIGGSSCAEAASGKSNEKRKRALRTGFIVSLLFLHGKDPDLLHHGVPAAAKRVLFSRAVSC